MRNLFAIVFVLVSMFVSGCYLSHERPDFVVPMEDSGPFVGDAGPEEPDLGPTEPDSGPIVMVDGGPGVLAIIVEPYVMRDSAILVANDGASWEQLASLSFHSDEGIPAVTAVDVIFDGDASNLLMIGIAADGLVYGDVLPSGVGSTKHIILDAPIAADTDGFGHFQIWAKIARVVPLSTVSGADIGSCNSGDRFRAGAYSVEGLIGSTPIGTTFDAIYGNEFVIRKSKPTITRQVLPKTGIANGADQGLYKFQESADAAGSIANKRIGMFMEVHSVEGRVCDLRLYKGSGEMSPSDYTISGPMFWDGERCWRSGGTLPLIIQFTGEETVTGSGNIYTIVGAPSGFVAGDSISISFNQSDDRIATGYLRSTWTSTSTDLMLDFSPYDAPDSTRTGINASLIWSDLSEVPHSAEVGRLDGSRDWTNGYLVEDLTQTSRLSI
jgi:hypothetical protein